MNLLYSINDYLLSRKYFITKIYLYKEKGAVTN